MGQANFVYQKFTQNTTAYLHNKWLNVGSSTNALSFYKENMKELKEHFQFKVGQLINTICPHVLILPQDIYLRSARTALQMVAASLRTEDRVLYVGLHCR